MLLWQPALLLSTYFMLLLVILVANKMMMMMMMIMFPLRFRAANLTASQQGYINEVHGLALYGPRRAGPVNAAYSKQCLVL